MKPISEILANNIRELRDDLWWSQEQLAERAELSPTFVQKVEGQHTWVGTETIAAIAKALDVPESRLFVDLELMHVGTHPQAGS